MPSSPTKSQQTSWYKWRFCCRSNREKGRESSDTTGPAKPKGAPGGSLQRFYFKEALKCQQNSTLLINVCNWNCIDVVALFVFNLQAVVGSMAAQEL